MKQIHKIFLDNNRSGAIHDWKLRDVKAACGELIVHAGLPNSADPPINFCQDCVSKDSPGKTQLFVVEEAPMRPENNFEVWWKKHYSGLSLAFKMDAHTERQVVQVVRDAALAAYLKGMVDSSDHDPTRACIQTMTIQQIETGVIGEPGFISIERYIRQFRDSENPAIILFEAIDHEDNVTERVINEAANGAT